MVGYAGGRGARRGEVITRMGGQEPGPGKHTETALLPRKEFVFYKKHIGHSSLRKLPKLTLRVSAREPH
jgi:hypothetical protein